MPDDTPNFRFPLSAFRFPCSAFRFPLLFLLGFSFAMLAGCVEPAAEPEVEVTPVVRRPLPKLEVEGWLNGGPLSPEDMKGNVVVVDCWASWCQPCAQAAPALVATYMKYRHNGVRFMGMTSEKSEDMEKIEEFINRYLTNWPIAYGAEKPLLELQVDAIPRVFVVGRDGLIAWDSDQPGTLERAIRDALAESAEASAESGERKAESGKTPSAG